MQSTVCPSFLRTRATACDRWMSWIFRHPYASSHGLGFNANDGGVRTGAVRGRAVEVVGSSRHGAARHRLASATQTSNSIQVMALHFFWFVATIDVVLSIGFELRICAGRTRNLNTECAANLASSQRKDTWVACAAIWAVLLSDGCPLRWLACATGAAVLTWLLQRTLRRFRALR